MAFRDVFQEGGGISIPVLKFEQMVKAKQLVQHPDGTYTRDFSRKVAVFDGFETFFDHRGGFAVEEDGERVITARAAEP